MGRTVTLSDRDGNLLGEEDILKAHAIPGMLHRAFSVYVFRKNRTEILIQQRSAKKMLWPGIWANTCCSHPFPGEGAEAAGQRRLVEELGFTCPLTAEGTFVYQAIDPENRGAEHEHVTILVGDADPQLVPNPDEVMAVKWMPVAELRNDMALHHDAYAPWFHQGLEQILSAQ